ncbi:MAG: NAD(P)-dependent oxidoreductase, partial [Waterburya sp.]
MKQPIGFIGLGNMGLPMANNLIDAGYKLKVYNRTAEKAQSLIAKGAELAQTSTDAVTPGGIMITMLPNDHIVEGTVLGDDGILKQLGRDGIHLSMSTLSPATVEKLAQAHQQAGAYYLASPVLGRPDVAQAGKLNICLSGDSAAKEKVQPLLEVLGQKVYDFG